MAEKRTIRRFFVFVLALAVFFLLLWLFSGLILTQLGQFLICDEKPGVSDAVVVLNTGVEYYPRLIEAADLFRKGLAQKVVINGNRKTEVLRDLEKRGFKNCCPWYEDSVRILELLGVPRRDTITISAEDAYDTVSEAEAVGRELVKKGIGSVIVVTSKSHTRRAHFIWSEMYDNKLSISVVPARSDPYNPKNWWKDGRQIR